MSHFASYNQSLTNLIKIVSFEITSNTWGIVTIALPSDAHMIINAWSNNYLLIRETYSAGNTGSKYDAFRCLGQTTQNTLSIAPNVKVQGWICYV